MKRLKDEITRDLSDLRSLINSDLRGISPDNKQKIANCFSSWFEFQEVTKSSSAVERCVFLLKQIINDEKWKKFPRPIVKESHKNSLVNSSKKLIEAFDQFEKNLRKSGVLDFGFSKIEFYTFRSLFHGSYNNFIDKICIGFTNYQQHFGKRSEGRPVNSTRDIDIIGLIDCIKKKEGSLEKAIEKTQSLLSAIGMCLSDDSLHRIWKKRNLPGGRRLSSYPRKK